MTKTKTHRRSIRHFRGFDSAMRGHTERCKAAKRTWAFDIVTPEAPEHVRCRRREVCLQPEKDPCSLVQAVGDGRQTAQVLHCLTWYARLSHDRLATSPEKPCWYRWLPSPPHRAFTTPRLYVHSIPSLQRRMLFVTRILSSQIVGFIFWRGPSWPVLPPVSPCCQSIHLRPVKPTAHSMRTSGKLPRFDVRTILTRNPAHTIAHCRLYGAPD